MRAGRRVCIAALLVLLAACSGAPLATGPVAVVVSPTRTESPARSSPPPAAQTTCRVPFSVISEASGGFITYPGGQRQDDPSSVVALPGYTPGQIGVNPGLAYDRALGRWVPVPPEWLAPGALTYAYADFTGTIRAVTPGGGSEDVTADGGWELISTADTGVYAARPNVAGAWFVPFGGVPQQIVDRGSWQRYFNGVLWGIDGSGQVFEHDLTSGAETVWGTVN